MPVPNPQTEEDWLSCIGLPEYLQRIPAGHILMITGEEIWIDGNDCRFDTAGFIARHGVDPNVVWAAKKKYLKERGGGVHIEK